MKKRRIDSAKAFPQALKKKCRCTISWFLGPGPVLLVIVIFAIGCSEVRQPQVKEYFANTPPPARQEFRWSNGNLPKTVDPAAVSAPPETDIVRAIFEGLTELDPVTLEPRPAAAALWEASEDMRTWRFSIRDGAKWSNGRPVLAEDFVSSWKRALTSTNVSAHRQLLMNIRGAEQLVSVKHETSASTAPSSMIFNTVAAESTQPENERSVQQKEPFGAVAEDERTLVVELASPDRDFAKLVAHPIFRPVYADGKGLGEGKISDDIVVNGPFVIVSSGSEGVTLKRSESYWNRPSVKLETVRFVPSENGEKALEAYRSGEVDVVTNVDFSPLALKLLEPYEDFRRTTFAAVNLYEINLEKPVFRDRLVREALAISIERERLTDGELEGATHPAHTFLPFSRVTREKLVQDKDKARELLEKAGYPDGDGFPAIKLTVNRNDTQIRIARSVAEMWKRHLNIDTEVVVREGSEMESLRESGQYDVIRRGVVLPTNGEGANLRNIFGSAFKPGASIRKDLEPVRQTDGSRSSESTTNKSTSNENVSEADNIQPFLEAAGPITNEEDALFELTAIPLYFPSSYSLVRPFVFGFETNSLDASLLHEVYIDVEWDAVSAAAEE